MLQSYNVKWVAARQLCALQLERLPVVVGTLLTFGHCAFSSCNECVASSMPRLSLSPFDCERFNKDRKKRELKRGNVLWLVPRRLGETRDVPVSAPQEAPDFCWDCGTELNRPAPCHHWKHSLHWFWSCVPLNTGDWNKQQPDPPLALDKRGLGVNFVEAEGKQALRTSQNVRPLPHLSCPTRASKEPEAIWGT